jgi:geranylgeranyl diphosphate synthase, type II
MLDRVAGRAGKHGGVWPENFDLQGFEQTLAGYNKLTNSALLKSLPSKGPRYLYDLVSEYPARGGKGLRAALCLAMCGALGGKERRALHIAVAIELFHNGFLIHDDLQDASLSRRGGATLHRAYGNGIAINVGNATNLIGMQRVIESRGRLGPTASFAITEETHSMMRHSLEGQAIELAWIRDNACKLKPSDYLQMCLKKTSWYSFIYPMRVGAIIARGAPLDMNRFCRFGWYFGAAFQIQDDILNLTGDYAKYGKELAGDLAEGKRTLMLIHLLNVCTATEKSALKRFLAKPREKRSSREIAAVHAKMIEYGSIEFARSAARQLAGAALFEGAAAFRGVPNSPQQEFIFQMVHYVINRDR